MKICVLQPDYQTTDVDYKNYDPPRNLSSLLPNDDVTHVFLNKLSTYKQLKRLSKEKYDIYINLCEGYLDWSVPSIDVIHSLDLLNLPYTGPSVTLYDPPKTLMKYVAYCASVRTPNFIEVNNSDKLLEQIHELDFPLFIKPSKAGDSLGIDEHSLVYDFISLKQKVNTLLNDSFDDVLIEEYIDGREYTVLVAANAAPLTGCTVFTPIEYRFPKENKFKTYALKTSELHTNVNVPCNNPELEQQLRSATEKIFNAFSGVGYARLDFRVNSQQQIYFLEINFTCSVFYEQGYEGSADYILNYDPIGKKGFLQHIIAEGIARYLKKQRKYTVKGNAIYGYGIFANRFLSSGETIFHIEESAQHIVTKKYVMENWNAEQMNNFKHYAYPISDEVYILWDADASNWAPQNHSCNPNTAYKGLNLIALRPILKDEELTLDYAELLNEMMDSFECHCGSKNCRKVVNGLEGNSITQREKNT